MLKVVGASWEQTKVSSLILALVATVGVVVIILGEVGRVEEDGNYSATVYWNDGSGFRIEYWGESNDLQEIPNGAARAVYSPKMDNNGWAKFEVETDENYPDSVQAYAAGLLEGSLSWQLMYWHWQNTVQDTCQRHEQLCDKIRQFVIHNREYVRTKAKKHKDHFWHQVELFYAQLDGLEAGWREGVERSRQPEDISIPHEDFLLMNAMTDMLDLEKKFDSSIRQERSVPATFSSAFVKLLPETKQLFVAHNTGARYQSMLRMMKRYNFNYHLLHRSSMKVPGKDIVFSSYPGALSSHDDFYVVKGTSEMAENAHKIVVAGTAIDNYNIILWDTVNNEKVLSTARVMVANRLASDGKTWAEHLEKHNSGTGNKQWVVADYGRLVKIHLQQSAVDANTLRIVEPQMTGRTALDKDDLSTHVIHVEASERKDAAPSIRMWEVKSKNAESLESLQETRLVLETSHLFDDASTPRSKEGSNAAPDLSETPDAEESFTNVESVDMNDAEQLDRSFSRGRRKFSSYKGLLWVVEQLPSLTRSSDRSHTLHKSGYWASFGLPCHKDILDASEIAKMQQRDGEAFSNGNSAKVLIFRKNQRNVMDLQSLISLMRSTGPLPDALSSMNLQHVVAGRGDLALATPAGTIDTKIFAGAPGRPSSVQTIAGPSYNTDNNNDVALLVKPFQWSKSSFSKTTPHFGQPDTWQFPMFTPQWAWTIPKEVKVS